jgi:hypothetical protein
MAILRRKSNFLIVLGGCLLAASCNQGKPAAEPQTPSAISEIAKLGNLATDPFAQMSLTFEGNPSKEEIQPKVDRVMGMYGLELTDPNRSHVGSTLVTLRKEHGHSEMAILDKMLESPASGEFETSAAAVSESMTQ